LGHSSPSESSLARLLIPGGWNEGLRLDDLRCLVDEVMFHCWKDSVCWIWTGLIQASTLASLGGGRHLLVLYCSVGPVSLSALRGLNAVGFLKVKPSLPRFRTPWKHASGHTAVVQYLDALTHELSRLHGQESIHPLARRQSWIATISRTVPSSDKRLTIDQGVTLD
jgi:hypothetical protein